LEASPLEFVPLDWLEPWSGSDRPPLWLALDHVQDPQNFGAILRSCVYFGVDGVVVPYVSELFRLSIDN
jgi:tRNA G18 (ribose-2'-O)-methylase SpoU